MAKAALYTKKGILKYAFQKKHICLFYRTLEDMLYPALPYLKSGLKNNDYCTWITSKPFGTKETKRVFQREIKNFDTYIKKGQLEIMDYQGIYVRYGRFDPEKTMERWAAKEKEVLERGFSKMRVASNISWFDKKDWEKLIYYEKMVNDSINEHKVKAFCIYPIENFNLANIFLIGMHHEFVFSCKNGRVNVF